MNKKVVPVMALGCGYRFLFATGGWQC
jgi:hypothetical protein